MTYDEFVTECNNLVLLHTKKFNSNFNCCTTKFDEFNLPVEVRIHVSSKKYVVGSAVVPHVKIKLVNSKTRGVICESGGYLKDHVGNIYDFLTITNLVDVFLDAFSMRAIKEY